MSSVHSQTSEVEVPQAAAVKSEDGPANGDSRNGSDTSIVSMKSTITFEKQKVVPRTRTMSVQSVLSSISLRSILNKDQGTQHAGEDYENGSCSGGAGSNINNGVVVSVSNFINATQQIQSPAMASTIMKKRNGPNGKMKQTLLLDLPMNESYSKIGQQLPFTDDKRKSAPDLRNRRSSLNSSSETSQTSSEGKSMATEQPSEQSQNPQQQTVSSHNGSPTDTFDSSHGSESEEDDISKQNKLTTDALRKLSMLQQHKNSTVKSMQITPLTSSENLMDPKEPLTHIKFGGKNVILDTTRKNSVAFDAPTESDKPRKQSLEILSQPTDVTLHSPNNFQMKSTRSSSSTSSNSKRPLRQINEPKKPMYTPAVLRDISETNITINNLRSHSPTPSVITQTTLQAVLSRNSNNYNPNYARSVSSTTSSIMSNYKNKVQSWWSRETELCPPTLQPTRSHWVPDAKRHSCKYCHKIFTFWERKHHCRHCGDIYCQQHVRHWLYLNPKAKFIIGTGGVGVLSKICDGCLEEYDSLVRAGPSKDQQLQQQQQQLISQGDIPATNGSATNKRNSGRSASRRNSVKSVPQRNIDEALSGAEDNISNRQRLDNIVGSVPADWSWSSF